MPALRLAFARTLSWREPLSFLSTPILCSVAWSKWSHVALVMADGETIIDATFTHGGVRQRALADLVRVSEVGYRDVPCPNPAAGYAFALAQRGKPYDARGVIGLGLHRDWQSADAWWCSELVEACISAAGRQRFVNDAQRVTQRDSWIVA